MKDLDVNTLIQAFNEKIAQLTTEVIVKEATIKQLNIEVQTLLKAIQDASKPDTKVAKKQSKIEENKTDDFE